MMNKYISITIIFAVLLYPVLVGSSYQKPNVALWQGILASILQQTSQSIATDIEDVNGDSIVDVRDLCMVVQKINHEKTKLPGSSKTFRNLVIFSSAIRSDKVLLTIKNFNNNNQQNMNITFINQDKNTYSLSRYYSPLKNVYNILNPFIEVPFIPLLC